MSKGYWLHRYIFLSLVSCIALFLYLLLLRFISIFSVMIPSSTAPTSSPFVFFHFFCVLCWVAQLSVAQVSC